MNRRRNKGVYTHARGDLTARQILKLLTHQRQHRAGAIALLLTLMLSELFLNFEITFQR